LAAEVIAKRQRPVVVDALEQLALTEVGGRAQGFPRLVALLDLRKEAIESPGVYIELVGLDAIDVTGTIDELGCRVRLATETSSHVTKLFPELLSGLIWVRLGPKSFYHLLASDTLGMHQKESQKLPALTSEPAAQLFISEQDRRGTE